MRPWTLRATAAAGTAAVCGMSALIVVSDPKPATAPLRPPVAGATQNVRTGALVIPSSCGAAASGRPPVPTPLASSLAAAYAQFTQATTPASRAAVLATLTADQRQQLIAYSRAQQRRATANRGGARCAAPTSTGAAIAPSISDAPPAAAPLVNSYVS